MKTIIMTALSTLLGLTSLAASATEFEPFQTYTRPALPLNGEWKIIFDPYENGYYNYRYEPFDQMDNPPRSAYFRDAKPRHSGELIEYDFDASESLTVPGDWNTQKEKLYYYEGNTLSGLAKKTGISRNSLFTTIDKVREQLKDLLDE